MCIISLLYFWKIGFGTTSQNQPSTGGFFSNLNQPQQTSSLFSGFGQPGQQSTFGSFGTTTQPTGLFSQTAQAQQIPQQVPQTAEGDYASRLAACVQNPFVFGDERDQVLAKFNSTLATLGTGKAWYASNFPPLDLNAENVFCKWKVVNEILHSFI